MNAKENNNDPRIIIPGTGSPHPPIKSASKPSPTFRTLRHVDLGALRTLLWRALSAYLSLAIVVSIVLGLSVNRHMGLMMLAAVGCSSLVVALAIGLGSGLRRLRSLLSSELALDTEPSLWPDLRRIKTLTHGDLTLDIANGQILTIGTPFEPALDNGNLVLKALMDTSFGAKPTDRYQHWGIPCQGLDTSHKFSLPHHSTPLLYWALWQIAKKNNWGLKSRIGGQTANDIQANTAERIGRQLGWVQGLNMAEGQTQDIDGRTAQGKDKPIPLCEFNGPNKTVYSFPDIASTLNEDNHEVNVDRWLRFIMVICIVGIVTLPLAFAIQFIRRRTPSSHNTLAINGSTITINGRRQPLHALQYISAIPVHDGPPMILTERSALHVGGLEQYEDRVTWGKHILERVALSLGDRRFEAAAEHPTKPHQRGLWQPLHKDERWRSESGVLGVVSFGILVLMGLVTLTAMKEWWEPWWSMTRHGIVLRPDGVPWCMFIGTAILIGLCTLGMTVGKAPRVYRAMTVLQIPAWMFFAAVLSGFSTSGHERIIDISDFKRPAETVHINAMLPLLTYPHSAFNEKDLRYIDMTRAELKDLRIEDSNLQGVSMREVRLHNVFLHRSDISDADLTGAALQSNMWLYVTASRTRFAELKATGLVLNDSQLSGASFVRAGLKGARFKNSTLKATNFAEANMEKVDLRSVKASGIRMERANLTGANLAGGNFSGANMSHADLADAILTDANLSHATLVKTSFTNADLNRTIIDNANLTGVSFASARLNRTNLSYANLTDANFIGAKLDGVNLLSANLTGADFTNADLTGVDLSRSDLSGANLTGASLSNFRYDGLKFSTDTICPSGQRSAADTFCPKPPPAAQNPAPAPP